jgi:hypothetical protein
MRIQTIRNSLIAVLTVCLVQGFAQSQVAQEYEGAKITVLGIERIPEYHSGQSKLAPKNKEHELLMIRLQVVPGSKSISLSRSNVKLFDAQGKKYDYGAGAAVNGSDWSKVTTNISQKEGTIYLDLSRSILMTLESVKVTQLFFGIPKGTELNTLAIGNLSFDLKDFQKAKADK